MFHYKPSILGYHHNLFQYQDHHSGGTVWSTTFQLSHDNLKVDAWEEKEPSSGNDEPFATWNILNV